MVDFTDIFAIFCIFVAPLWLIMHYASEQWQAQGLLGEDEKMLSDLWQIANRMAGRIKPLESTVDAQIPSWRDKA